MQPQISASVLWIDVVFTMTHIDLVCNARTMVEGRCRPAGCKQGGGEMCSVSGTDVSGPWENLFIVKPLFNHVVTNHAAA